MTKPVSFYVSALVSSDCILNTLENEWGGYYEKLSNCEKFFLLAQISRNLYVLFADGTDVRKGVRNAAARIREEIPPDQCLEVIEALCDQLKSKQ